MSLDLISKEDFVGFRNIDFPESNATFEVYAAQAEELVLTDLFGADMYADMLANPTELKYVTLINDYLKTMMRGYFYYYFNTDRESYSTSIGEFEAQAENAVRNRGSRNKKVIDAWNNGTNQYVLAYGYVNENKDVYTLYTETQPRQKLNIWGINFTTSSTAGYPCDHSDWFIRGAKC